MTLNDAIRALVTFTVTILATGVVAEDAAARVHRGTPGATVHVGQVLPFEPATFTDVNTGQQYFVAMFATQTEPGVGTVAFALSDVATPGPQAGDGIVGGDDAKLSFCSSLGPAAKLGVQDGVLTGSQAGAGTRCGAAPIQIVGISAQGALCQATIKLHGFAHLNAPYPPFVGNLTVEIHVQHDGAAANISVAFYTFTGKIVLSGPLSGPVAGCS